MNSSVRRVECPMVQIRITEQKTPIHGKRANHTNHRYRKFAMARALSPAREAYAFPIHSRDRHSERSAAESKNPRTYRWFRIGMESLASPRKVSGLRYSLDFARNDSKISCVSEFQFGGDSSILFALS